MSLAVWLQFFLAAWVISLSPGPGAVVSMDCGMRYGYRYGLYNIAGLLTGIVFLVLIVALGLGALLAASQTAFTLIKYFGVAYLIWLGISYWRAPSSQIELGAVSAISPGQLFIKSFLIHASNPKGIVFMLAVLPQFIDIHKPLALQYAICGLTLVLTDFVVMSGYTVLAARILKFLRTPRQIKYINRSLAALFIGTGLLLANFKRA